MKKLWVPAFVFLFSVGFITSSTAQDKSAKIDAKEVTKDNTQGATQSAEVKVVKSDVKAINTTCPVSNEDIDDPVKVEYKGKTYALCCKTCLKKFQKDPEKYMKKMEEQGITLEKCPEPEKKK